MSNHSGAETRSRSALDTLPPDLSRQRVLDTHSSCEFVGVSIAHWRRLRARQEAPPPVMIGARKQGWRIGTLIDWLESREKREPAP